MQDISTGRLKLVGDGDGGCCEAGGNSPASSIKVDSAGLSQAIIQVLGWGDHETVKRLRRSGYAMAMRGGEEEARTLAKGYH